MYIINKQRNNKSTMVDMLIGLKPGKKIKYQGVI